MSFEEKSSQIVLTCCQYLIRPKNFLERSPLYLAATNLTKQCPLTKGLTRKFNRAYERDLTMLNTNIIMLAKNNINVMYEKVFFFITQSTLQQMLHAVQGVIIHLLLSIMLVVSTFHIYVLGFKYLLSASLFVCKYVCDACRWYETKLSIHLN